MFILPKSTSTKRREHPHIWLTHRLIHSSPTTAKIITSQGHHNILLLDQLSPIIVMDRCPPSPGRADSEIQLKQISINLEPTGFTIIPFFFLCVFGHWVLCLSAGGLLTKPPCLLKLSNLCPLPFCHLRPKTWSPRVIRSKMQLAPKLTGSLSPIPCPCLKLLPLWAIMRV